MDKHIIEEALEDINLSIEFNQVDHSKYRNKVVGIDLCGNQIEKYVFVSWNHYLYNHLSCIMIIL